MRKLTAAAVILALLIVTVMMNLESTNYSSKSDYQAALNSNVESVQLDESELIYEGAFNWRKALCLAGAAIGYGIGVAGMLSAVATGGLTFWLGFAATRLAIYQAVDCVI